MQEMDGKEGILFDVGGEGREKCDLSA
jgi:hypothetical protein